jgi:hypothetical protein
MGNQSSSIEEGQTIQWSKEKKSKRTNNDLQSSVHKTKDRVIRTLTKTKVNSGAPERKGVPVPLVAPVVLL